MIRTRMPAGLLLAIGAIALALAGCSHSSTPSGGSVPHSPSSSGGEPSMEVTLADLRGLSARIQGALDKRFGARPWAVIAPEGNVLTHVGCESDQDPDSEVAYLPAVGFRGTYEESRWKDAARLVLDLGKADGFDTVVVLGDRPDDYVVEAVRDDGARLQLGFAANTTLSLTTGCHRWDRRPSPGPVRLD